MLDKYATDNDEFSDVEASQVSNFMPIPSKIPEFVNFVGALFSVKEGKNLAYNISKGLVKNFPNHVDTNWLHGNLNSEVYFYPLAKKYILRALKLDPNNAKAHISYGIIRIRFEGDEEGALAEYKKALEINPNLIQANYNLGATYNSLQMPEMAEYYFRKSLELEPDNWMAIFSLSVLVILEKKNKQEFLSLMNRFENLYPENPYLECLYFYKESIINKNKAKAWEHQERFIEKGQQSHMMPPEIVSSHIGSHTPKKFLKKIKKISKEMVEEFPNEPNTLNNRGLSLFLDGKIEEAEKFYKKALEISPIFIPVKINYLLLLLFKNRIKEAKEICNEILKSSPDSITAKFSLALIFLNEEKLDDTRKLLIEILKSGENILLVNYFLAFSHLKENNYVEAEKFAVKSLNENFPFGFCYYLCGKIQFLNEKYELSKKNLHRFIEFEKSFKTKKIFPEYFSEAYFYLGHINYAIDRIKQARKNLKLAIKIEKDKRFFNDISVIFIRLRKFGVPNNLFRKKFIDSGSKRRPVLASTPPQHYTYGVHY